MKTEPVELKYSERVEPASDGQLVPYFHYIILVNGEKVGHINLRDGSTIHVEKYAGHIGYFIEPEHRGNGYSYKACLALKTEAFKLYNEVVLTAEISNLASIRVIEKLGARYKETLEVPESDPAFSSGGRVRKRYVWCQN